MLRKIFLSAILSTPAVLSFAAELTLFDIPLRTASREDIKAAITHAGGKLKSASRDADKFDASSIGVPDAMELEVIYLNNRLVMAQYSFQSEGPQDERFRKMLVAKYNHPSGSRGFDQQYIADGKYRWGFDSQMELVYTKEFFGSRYLSYVNKVEQDRLGRLVKEADQRAAEKEAAAKKSVF